MKEFLTEEALQAYLDGDALFQGDLGTDDHLYLLCCKTRTREWFKLFTSKELNDYMQENMVDNTKNLVLNTVQQAGKRCTVVFRSYTVMSDYIEKDWTYLRARGEFRDGVFHGEFYDSYEYKGIGI